MYPNGGTSHLTPMMKRLRDLMSAGSGGRLACTRAAPFGLADPKAAASTATTATPTVTRKNFFIPPLLLRLSTIRRASARAGASAAGSAAFAPLGDD